MTSPGKPAPAEELAAADAGGAVVDRGVQVGQRLVAEEADGDVVGLDASSAPAAMSVRASSAARTAPAMSTATGVNAAASVGTSRAFHWSVGVLAVDEGAQRIFGAGDGGLGHDHRFLALRDLGFGLHDVDRRHGADLDPGAVLLQRALRQVERQALHVEAVQREHQVPVGVLHRARRAWPPPRAPARRRSRGSCARPAAAGGCGRCRSCAAAAA